MKEKDWHQTIVCPPHELYSEEAAQLAENGPFTFRIAYKLELTKESPNQSSLNMAAEIKVFIWPST